MRARRKHLIAEVMTQCERLTGLNEPEKQAFKTHLEQFTDDEIAKELEELKKLDA